MLWAIIVISRRKVGFRSLPTLAEITTLLVEEKKFAELTGLLEPNLDLLSRVSHEKFRTAGLRAYLAKLDDDRNLIELMSLTGQEVQLGFRYRMRAFAARLALLIPKFEAEVDAANSIFRAIFQSQEIVLFIARYRPNFGLKLLSLPLWAATEFCESFLRYLIADPQSILYQELRHNQSMARVGYTIPKHNRLLHFFFADADRAYRLSAWNGVGQYVLSELEKDGDYRRFLNGAATFFESEQWQDKTFVGIFYFDVMVGAAEAQNVPWHMWLYFFPPIMEQLISIYDESAPDVDPEAEWPTRGAALIYEMFRCMLKWIEEARHLPDDSCHKKLESTKPTHQNGNIPKSAGIALGRCLKSLLLAENVGERFKAYIHSIVLRHIRDLPNDRFREMLINCVLDIGAFKLDAQYGLELTRLYGLTDSVMKWDLKDYEKALNATY
jgi:hypothetical protein